MNKLRSVLELKGIQNANQLKVATKNADPNNRGIGQATSLSAWNDPFWTPSAPVLELICRTFNIQPGDWLYYLPDDTAKIDTAVEMLGGVANGR